MFQYSSNPNTSPDIPSIPLIIESNLYKRRAQSKESDLDKDFPDYDTLESNDGDGISKSGSSLYLDSAVYVLRSELERKLALDKFNASYEYGQKYGLVKIKTEY